MSWQVNREGLVRWFCDRCEPRYEQWGPWGRPTGEHMRAVELAERQHEIDWHIPVALRWPLVDRDSGTLGVSNPGDSEPR